MQNKVGKDVAGHRKFVFYSCPVTYFFLHVVYKGSSSCVIFVGRLFRLSRGNCLEFFYWVFFQFQEGSAFSFCAFQWPIMGDQRSVSQLRKKFGFHGMKGDCFLLFCKNPLMDVSLKHLFRPFCVALVCFCKSLRKNSFKAISLKICRRHLEPRSRLLHLR